MARLIGMANNAKRLEIAPTIVSSITILVMHMQVLTQMMLHERAPALFTTPPCSLAHLPTQIVKIVSIGVDRRGGGCMARFVHVERLWIGRKKRCRCK